MTLKREKCGWCEYYGGDNVSLKDKIVFVKEIFYFIQAASRTKKKHIAEMQECYDKKKGRIMRMVITFPDSETSYEKNLSVKHGEIMFHPDTEKPSAVVRLSINTLRSLIKGEIYYEYSDGSGGEIVDFTPRIALSNNFIVIEKIDKDFARAENILEDLLIFQSFYELLSEDIKEAIED